MTSPTLVQSAKGDTVANLAYASNIAAGSLLVAAIAGPTTATYAPTDTRGNTWVKGPVGTDATDGAKVEIWYVLSANGAGANTVNHNGSGTTRMIIWEWNPQGNTMSYAQNSNNSGTGSPTTPGSITTTVADAIVINASRSSVDTILNSDPAGYTRDQVISAATTWRLVGYSKVRTTTGAENPSMAHNGTGITWCSVIAAFSATPSSGGPTKIFLRDAASDITGALVEKLANLVQGSALVSKVMDTSTSGTVQVTDTQGGTAIEWYTPGLNAVTIAGTITLNIWGLESAIQANAGLRVLIQRTDNAGAVISTILDSSKGTELGTTASVQNWTGAPTSTTLAVGDRLKITVFGVSAGGSMPSGRTFTVGYGAGTGVNGDSYIQLTEGITLSAIFGQDTIAGAATISATGTVTRNAQATIAGTGVVNATGTMNERLQVNVYSGSTLVGVTSITPGSIPLWKISVPAGIQDLITNWADVRIELVATTEAPSLYRVYQLEYQTASGAGAPITGQATIAGSGALSGTGTVTKEHTGQATLAGAGVLSATGTYVQLAQDTIPGAATVVATGTYVRLAQDTIAGAATTSFTALLLLGGQLTVTGLGAVLGTGTLVTAAVLGQATIPGIATLTITGSMVWAAQDIIAGQGALTATGRLTLLGAETIPGVGLLSATGTYLLVAQDTIPGVGAVVPTGTINKLGTETIAGVGSLTGTALTIFGGKATIAGIGAVVPNAVLTMVAAETIAGTSSMTPLGGLFRLAQDTIAGIGALTATSLVQHTAQDTIAGQGALIAAGSALLTARMTSAGTGALVAYGFVIQFDLLPVPMTRGRVHAEIYSPSGVHSNLGPLAWLYKFQYHMRLDGLGDFMAQVPVSDDRVNSLKRGTQLWFYHEGEGLVFKGKVMRKEYVIKDGEMLCEITGSCLGEELSNVTTLGGRAYQGATLVTVMADMVSGTGWSVGLIGSPATQLTARYDYLTRVNAINKTAQNFRYHTRFNNVEKTVDVDVFGEASGLTFEAVNSMSPLIRLNPKLAPISELTIMEEGEELVNKVVPIGGGEGVNQTTLRYSTRSSPYPIQTATGPDGEPYYYISDSTSQSAYGIFERAITVKEAVPLANSVAGQQNIANALYDIAVTYLLRHKDERNEYTVHVENMRHYDVTTNQPIFKVGQKARVRWAGYARKVDNTTYLWKTIDADLYILEFTREIGQEGHDAWDVVICDVDRLNESFGGKVAEIFDDMFTQQVSLKNYTFRDSWTLQRMSIESGSPATMYAQFDANISLLHLAKLSTIVRPVRSNVSVVSSGGGTTSSGGTSHSHSVSGSTSGGGSSHSHSISGSTVPPSSTTARNVFSGESLPVGPNVPSTQAESAAHAHQVWSAPSLSDNNSPTHTHSMNSHYHAQPTIDAADTLHTHTISGSTSGAESSHSHSISGSTSGVESTHTHTVSAHTHPLTYGIYTGPNPSSPAITITINGVDRTAALGGPFNSVNTEFTVDITQYLQSGATEVPLQATNTIQFGASVLCDIESVLRLDLTRSALIPV